jgi:exopolysaccharide biosynthesis polyprenyl glycosylphosphotransferase
MEIAAADPLMGTGVVPARERFERGRARMLAGADLVALTVAYAASYAISAQIAPLPPVSAPGWFIGLLLLTVPLIWVAVFTAYGLYENDSRRISVTSFDEVGDIFHAILAGSLAFLILSQAVRHLFGWWIYTAVEAFLFLAAALIVVPVVRGSIRSWVFPRVMRRRRAVIVGVGPEADLVMRKLNAHPEYGLDVVARFDGGDKDLTRAIDELDADRVLLAAPAGEQDELLELLRNVRRSDVQVSILPRYCDIFTSHAIIDEIEGIPVVSVPPMRLGRPSRALKRGFDISVSSALLILLAPILALISLAIRLDSPGSPFFRQPRRGREGSTFSIMKFRTMHSGAEARRGTVLHLNEVDGPLFKVKKGSDPRVTRIGAFLRSTSLDELPQLWNVLRGDMSLVGPRPFVVYEADLITGWALRRLDMTPGITGLWQVLGRNDMPFEDMVKLDYLYVTNWSLWWDLKILCQTIPVVLGKRGAY